MNVYICFENDKQSILNKIILNIKIIYKFKINIDN